MNFHPSGAQQQQRMSLREEAMARAAAARGPGDITETTPVHPLVAAQQCGPSQQPSSPPAQVQNATEARDPSIRTTTAEEARKTWRLHGENASQVLEDRRSNLLAFPPTTTTSNGDGPLVVGGGSDSLFGEGYSVRVIATDTRIDPSGATYVVYVVSVETNRPTSSSGGGGGRTVVEHRYSEFAKLHAELRANGVRTRASFPSKSWAGRVGNWTPSATIAPERAEELVVYRKAKLDIWLVELCELLNGTEIRGEVREGVLEFLRVSGGAGRPPCDRANPVSWDGLGGGVGDTAAALADGSAIAAAQQRNGARHAAGAEKSLSNPISFTLGGSIRQATYTVMRMCSSSSKINATDQSIPLDLLQNAKGLCFLTVAKAGFVVSGRVGTGLIVSRQSDGSWSPPSAVGTVGVGWGALIGGDITDYLLVLNTEKAVQAFATTKKGTVNLGAELGAAVGPVGRGATGTVSAAGDVGICPVYAYAHSKGLFVGISLEGSVITSRPDVNAKFYGRPIGPAELLFGHSQPRPRAAKALYDALGEAMGVTIPEEGFRPSQMFAQDTTLQSRRGLLRAPVLHVSQSSGDIVAVTTTPGMAAMTTADPAVGRPPAESMTVR